VSRKRTFRKRTERIQVYVNGSHDNDALILDVWDAASRNERVQEVFRAILRSGIRSMVESGDMPASIVKECDLLSLFPPRLHQGGAPMVVPMPFYGAGMPAPPHAPHERGGFGAPYEPDFRDPPRTLREPPPAPRAREPEPEPERDPGPAAPPQQPPPPPRAAPEGGSTQPSIGDMLSLMGKGRD
jgi:Predicted membrane protein